MTTVAFVTGGSGYLGRNLIEFLLANGRKVHAIGRSEAARAAIEKLGATAFPGDLAAPEQLQAAAHGCTEAYHCAASVTMHGKVAEMRVANVDGTRTVIAACRTAGVRRFVHVSTEQAIVGKGRLLINADETWSYPENPLGSYAQTKMEAEKAALELNSEAMAVIVARPRLIWGKDDTTILPSFVEAVKKGELMWAGGGRHKTSTCHVTNVCEGLVCCADTGKAGEVYFLTDGEPVEFRWFVERMLKTADVEPPTREVPTGLVKVAATFGEAWSWVSGKPPTINHAIIQVLLSECTVNDAKARSEIGYKGQVSIEDGMLDLETRHKSG